MKTSLLLLAFCITGLDAIAQTPSKKQYIYCQVTSLPKRSNKDAVTVDFGNDLRWFSDTLMKDSKTGKPIVFDSVVDCLNFMGRHGWQVSQAYALYGGQVSRYHFLLQQPVDSLSDEEKAHIEK